MNTSESSPPLSAIFVLSAAALAYEVLLVRLFSVVQWHHFAFMVISIALLGYGASGSLITVLQRRLLARYQVVFLGNAALFGLSAIACFIAVQRLPFNALEILWDTQQWQRLLLGYLLLALPFFFVANAIALTMVRYPARIPLIYGVDLVGAGAGAIAIMLLLQLLPPAMVLRVLGVCGIAAALFALYFINGKQRLVAATLLSISAIAVLAAPAAWFELRLSEFKGLEQTLLVSGTRLLERHNDPVAQIDVVESNTIPFRDAPGLSLMSPAGPPPQLAVFRDGDEMTVIDRVTGPQSQVYRDYMSSALAYHVHAGPRRVLVLGAGTGGELLQAAMHDVDRIDAVEAETRLSRLISRTHADYFDWKSISDRVMLHAISPRGYVAVSNNKYDLVVLGVPGASSGGAAGVHALSASYDYTVEALRDYIDMLDADGLLSISLWTSTPPRGNLRLFATAVEALRAAGVDNPGDRMAWIRSWNTATLIIRNGRLTPDEISRVRDFSAARAFDIAWLPDVKAVEVNRYQQLPQPVFYLAASALLSTSAADFIDAYKFGIGPVGDDDPYFNNSFRWSSLPELLSMTGGGRAMIDVGYPTLLVTLVQALVAAVVLILLPLAFVGSKRRAGNGRRGRIVVYFMSIGLAFLFIELAFIQQFTLILSQPLYAVAVTLCAFLIFSGAGSLYVQRRLTAAQGDIIPRLLRRAVWSIATITPVYIFLLPRISGLVMAMPEPLRITIAFLLAAPLAFAMGMPFPLGLAATRQADAELLPWAWGINGCASVLSAVLAVLLAIEIGFSGVMLCAVLFYVLAWLSRPSAGLRAL